MKLISLNIWGGRLYEPLMNFIRERSADTDIFCLQEVFGSKSDIIESGGVRVNILADLVSALREFRYFLSPIAGGYDTTGAVDFDVTESLAIFVKEGANLKVVADGGVFLCGEYRRFGKDENLEKIPSKLQYVRLLHGNKKFSVANIHGLFAPGDKLDTPERLAQSQNVSNFLRGEDGSKILCGDFNLLPQTKSIAMIEETGMINLIKKFDIKSTRNHMHEAEFYKYGIQHFADYAFVSPDVRVVNFSVPKIAVSDHLPLVLEFS